MSGRGAVRTLAAWWASMPGIRPLLKLSYALNFSLGSGPAGFHALNIPIHAANAGLVFALFALSIPFGAGAIGQGDLKLLVSVGLMVGPLRLVYGAIYGALVAGLVLVVLLVLRRITLKSFVPYGPFLILGAIWAILVIR